MKLTWPALLLVALAGGCQGETARAPGEPAARDTPTAEAREAAAPEAAGITDEEIDRCIDWWRTDLELVRKHLAEMDELEDALEARYSFAELHKVQEDPELLAMMERQREERLEHRRSRSVAADGFDSVLAGLGFPLHRDGAVVYEIPRDERALQGARDKYGDGFVDKVLSRSEEIAAGMSRPPEP